jgi:hypothetical protein
MVFAVALLWVKLQKNEAYGESLMELVGQSVFAEDRDKAAELGSLDRKTAFRLAEHMRQANTIQVMNNYADMLESLAREHAGAAMLHVYPDLPPKLQDQLLLRIARLAPKAWEVVVWEAAKRGDAHLAETTARHLLAVNFPAALEQAPAWLETSNPRLRASAAVGLLRGNTPALRTRARETLETLLASPQPDHYLAALGALGAMPHEELLQAIRPRLVDESTRARVLALKIWSHCGQHEVSEAREIIDWALADPSHEVRAEAIRAAANLKIPDQADLEWLGAALRDPDYRVRRAGQACAACFLPKDQAAWASLVAANKTDFELQAAMVSVLAVSDIENRIDILNQMSGRHVRLARDKLLIMENLPSPEGASSEAFSLLRQVLREEAHRHLDAVLQILGCLDQSSQMSYIRAGLSSRDKNLWAQAMESAMQLKHEGRLFRELVTLFEAVREGVSLGGEPPGGKHALAAWMAWCQEFGSEWLTKCACYCLDSKKEVS